MDTSISPLHDMWRLVCSHTYDITHIVMQHMNQVGSHITSAMGSEKDAQDMLNSLGLSLSQFRFVSAVFAIVPVGLATRQIHKYVYGGANRKRKKDRESPQYWYLHLFSAASAFGLLSLAYGSDAMQFVAAGALVYSFMKFFPKWCGYLTWGTIFSYQVYLHYECASESNWNQGNIDFTGSFMMIALKLISIAMDYQDGTRNKESAHSFRKMPTILEYAGYLGAFGSIMVGPHFYFDEYISYVRNEGVYEVLNSADSPSTAGPALKGFTSSIFCCAFYFVLAGIIPDRPKALAVQDPSINVWEKLIIGFIANFGYRLKLYFAWHMAEASYIYSGFGLSGFSSYDGMTPVWYKAVNAAIIETETAPSVAVTVTKWNRHTGTWLRNYVYDRVPVGGIVALLVTQVICGLWHGFSASYIAFFAHSAWAIHCSRILYRIQTKYLPKATLPCTNALHLLFTLYIMNYLAGAYAVSSLDACLSWWRTMLYSGHIMMLVISCGGVFFPKRPKRSKEKHPASTDFKNK